MRRIDQRSAPAPRQSAPLLGHVVRLGPQQRDGALGQVLTVRCMAPQLFSGLVEVPAAAIRLAGLEDKVHWPPGGQRIKRRLAGGRCAGAGLTGTPVSASVSPLSRPSCSLSVMRLTQSSVSVISGMLC